MRQVISAIALCAGTVLAGQSIAQTGPAEFDPSDFGKIIIQPRQAAGSAGLVFEQAFGDYQNEPIIKYGETSPAVRLGKPIGRLDMLFKDGKTGFCTAFIVDDQHILTNHHCIPGMNGDPTGSDSGVQAAQFVAGFIKPGSSEGVDRYTVSPQIIETNRELDYTVLRVFGNPSTKYGKLELAEADPEDGEFLWIIGHPQGQAQHISREGCAAANPAISTEGKLMHSCDTLGGNSGSPVLRLSDKRVIALHHAGDSRTGFNMAIPMTRILPQSRVLKAAVVGSGIVPAQPTPTPTPTPAPAPTPTPTAQGDVCSALWAEAKILGCAGYEAYLADCGKHTFATMASRILERECSVPTVAPPASDVPVLTVKAGGGGDYSDLADAVASAEPGTRIEVYPGTYTRGIDVSKPLEIVGVGPVKDIVLQVAEANSVRWTAESGRIARMTILQDGGQYFNVHIAGGSVVLEDNEMSSKGLAVIAVRGNEGATIRRNIIRDGAQGGIFMFENGKALIESNTIFGNSLAGIEVKEGADPIVKNNTMRDGGGSGIFINEGGKGRYEGNTVFNNALSGIEAKAANEALIIGNTVRDGQQGGIMTSDGATVTITKNEIYGNAYAGIEIKSNSNPIVSDNVLRDGVQSGIYVHDGGRGVIENNEIVRNGFYGISVKDASTPIVRSNKIAANVYEAIRVREGGGGTYENNDLAGNTAGTFRIEADAGNVIRRGNIE